MKRFCKSEKKSSCCKDFGQEGDLQSAYPRLAFEKEFSFGYLLALFGSFCKSMLGKTSKCPNYQSTRRRQSQLFQSLGVLLAVGFVWEVSPQLEYCVIASFNVCQHIVVNLGDRVCCQHLDDHVTLTSLGAHSQVYNLRGVCILCDMSLDLDGLVRIQLVHVDLVGLSEFLLKFLTNGNNVTVLNHLLRELIQELLLRHWV